MPSLIQKIRKKDSILFSYLYIQRKIKNIFLDKK